MKKNTLDKLLGIDYPVIMAPMFLVSNTNMIKAALQNGISAAFPALNYRTDNELRTAIKEIKDFTNKPFGVNLIVNKSNPKYKSQLKTLIELKVDFIITSLGNPKEVINKAHSNGIKVFCDVVDLKYAEKVEKLGADAIIAVNASAGGHAGNIEAEELITSLTNNCNIPVISAGGITNGKDLKQVIEWGAIGASVGTIFIASNEAGVSLEYKNALIKYGEKDIIRTKKISGTPLTVINTPYVQNLGNKTTFLEWVLRKNKRLKKYAKMLITIKGMKKIEKAAFGATYKSVWCAGPAIEHVKRISPIKEIIDSLVEDYRNN
ncbi:MAG: nitronate monooxygenase [Chlorobi bacterium]|nr:nitronate monooxygenase [Chlorobiota bacterium]